MIDIRQPGLALAVIAGLLLSGCRSSGPKELDGARWDHATSRSISDADFRLERIDLLILYSSDTIVAVLRPVDIDVSQSRQLASWDVEYLAPNRVLTRVCPAAWRSLKDRLVGERKPLMLDMNAMFIDIGWRNIDNVISVFTDRSAAVADESGPRYQWRYETSGGIACSGEIGFVIRDEAGPALSDP